MANTGFPGRIPYNTWLQLRQDAEDINVRQQLMAVRQARAALPLQNRLQELTNKQHEILAQAAKVAGQSYGAASNLPGGQGMSLQPDLIVKSMASALTPQQLAAMQNIQAEIEALTGDLEQLHKPKEPRGSSGSSIAIQQRITPSLK